MSNEVKSNGRKNILINLSVFVLGGLIGAQATAIYFLVDAKSPQTPSSALDSFAAPAPVPLRQATLTPHQNQMNLPLQTESSPPDKTSDLGGGFFVGANVDYIIPLGTPLPEARKFLTSELKKLPGLTLGNGEREIFVLFDPICPECHKLFKMIEDDKELSNRIKAKFIPVNFFAHNESSRIASLYILTMINNGRHDEALQYMSDLVNRVPPTMMTFDEIPESVIADYDKGTMALLQTGTRVPFVTYRDKDSGELEFISGKPDPEDLDQVGMM